MEDKQYLSWRDIRELSTKLADSIRRSDFKPDCLIGITVGGLIPLTLLSKDLGVTDVRTVSAASYSGSAQGTLTVSNVPETDLAGRNVLLVDEIADTGETLKEVSRILREQCGANDMKIATLVVRTDKCKLRPDFSALDSERWVVFPWDEDALSVHKPL